MALSHAGDLASARTVNLTTYRRNGTPVTTPVWWIARGDRFYVGTTRNTGKVKRIRANGRVRVIACDASGRRESGVAREGTARIVDDPALRAEVQRAMIAKYGRWVFAFVMLIYRLRGQYAQRMLLELELRPPAV